MKVTELVEKLLDLAKNHGDLEVIIECDGGFGGYKLESIKSAMLSSKSKIVLVA